MSHRYHGKCPSCMSPIWVPIFFYSIYPPEPHCVNPLCDGEPKCGPRFGMKHPWMEEEKDMSPPKGMGKKMTESQKEEVKEKIEDTRKIVERIRQEQQTVEELQLAQEKATNFEKRIDNLESMMVLVAKSLKEIKDRLPPAPLKEPSTKDGQEAPDPIEV